MSLLAVGVSHQTAPVALLEQFAMGADDRVKALHELVGSDHVSEALVLGTCNRIEVFAEVEKFHGGVTDVSRVLARQAGATVEELAPYVTALYEDQAAAHLFTVASGLDSMVVGETQVLGQLRAAYALARQEGTVGRALHPVAQRALRVGKRVHTETGIDRAAAALAARAGRPLVVVDLALPRDVDPGVAALPGVHVVDLALLQGERSSTPGRPTAGPVAADDIAAAHALVETETALLRAERQAAEVAPTVSALRSQAADVVDAELLRLSTRLPDLDARARAEIARTVRRVVDKLLHEPTVRVKELAATSGDTDYAGALRALFGLGIDTPVEVLADAVTVDPQLRAEEAS